MKHFAITFLMMLATAVCHAQDQNFYIYLAIACIVAAAAMKDEEAPDLTKDILYKATSEEIKLLVKTVVELRMEWYHIPTTASIDKMKEDMEKKEKNVDQPATYMKQS